MISDHLRRCARSVAESRAKAAGRRVPNRADVSAGFAICTAQLQKYGYLMPGTNTPTLRGLYRGARLEAEEAHAQKMMEYEAMLARIRKHKAARNTPQALRGAANRAPTHPTLVDIHGAHEVPKTPAAVKAKLLPLRHALEDVFSCDTAYGDCSKDRPSTGHCFLVSLFVNDILGGDIVTSTVRDIPHYWCRVPVSNARGSHSGKFIDVDLTGDQFFLPAIQAKVGALYPKAAVFDRHPGERLNQPGNRKVMKLYDRLLKRVVPVLRKEGHGALACQIEVSCSR